MASPRPATALVATVALLVAAALLCEPAEARPHGGHHRHGGHHLHAHGHGHGGLRGRTAVVSLLCRTTDYPALCNEVSGRLRVVTPMSMAQAAAQTAISNAMRARTVADRLSLPPGMSKLARSSLSDCHQNYDDAVYDLKQGLAALQRGDHYTAMSDFSAAVSDVESCKDSFAERRGLVSPVAAINANLEKLISNCLALADNLKKK